MEKGERAVALWVKTLGADHPRLADILPCVARALMGLDRPKEALDDAERALAVSEHHVADPHELAETRFVLAMALVAAGGDRARAMTLAHQARDALASAQSTLALAEVDAWLAKNETK